MTIFTRLCAAAMLTLASSRATLNAQVTTGALSGYVLDPDHKPIAGATLKISDANGVDRQVTADRTGLYRAAGLPPALYRITASVQGFESSVINVAVNVDAHTRLDMELAIARQNTSVEVAANIARLSSDSSELGSVLDRKAIESLPLNRRDFLRLALLSPGVQLPVQDSELSSRGRFSMHVRGGREEFNNFLLDGVDNNDQYENTYTLQPAVDSIKEFKVVTGTYNAEYGRSAGGQVNVITRSGSNAWHGDVYSYLRNRALDARNFFDGSSKPQFHRNQSGAGAGGPLRHNRTFFYGNYDRFWEHRGLTRLATVPTLAQRSSIAPARVSRVGLQILNLFPLPNLPGEAGNYLAQPVLRETASHVNARVDHHASERNLFTARYSFGNQDLFEPFTHDSSDVPGFGNYVTNTGHNAMLHYQRVLSANTLNSLRIGFNQSFRRVLPENYRTNAGGLWGVSWLNVRPQDFGFPQINVSGFSLVGDQTQLPIRRYTDTYQIVEGFSTVRGAHALRLGAEVRNLRMNGSLDYFARGLLSFSGAITGSGIGDLLQGYPSFGIQAHFDNRQSLRTTAYNAYVQDDWKAARNLTIHTGLRYEFNSPPTDPYDRMAILDLKTNAIVNVGTNGIPRAGIYPDKNNFAPRVGFAWTPAKHIVMRGGYGVYYDAGMLVTNTSLYFNPPYFNVRAYFPTKAGLLTLDNPFPEDRGITPPPSPNTLSPGLTTGYLQDWSFGLDVPSGDSSSVSLSYAGSKGTHLLRSRDLNQALPGPGAVALRRPLPSYSGIFFTESGANSSYQSLQALVNRRFTRGVAFQASYTLSKSIDDTSAFLGTKPDKNFPQNSRDYRSERGLSSFDTRHRFTSAAVYAVPGRNMLLRGLELRGLLAAQSGQPFTPYLRFDNSNTGNSGGIFGLDRPDLLHSPALSNKGPAQWFDTSAFGIPAPYHFGSAGRNVLTGPGLFSIDMAVSRRFALGERASLSLDVEGFNVANHTQFDLPERYADQPITFGRIFSAKAARQIQCALRFSF
ncbi:MAG TPA: TonB-dependent receptor [Bryobacteraceae bacterium]|nr:TonB-dependent receptor [Bryobacteraceae bacterium]